MAIYADSPGQYEGLAQQQLQSDVGNYFRSLEAARANAALRSQLDSAAQDRQMQALNSMLRHKELNDALAQRDFANQLALRQLTATESDRADRSKLGWAGLSMDKYRIDQGNPRDAMYAEDRWKKDIEFGVPIDQISGIPADKMPLAQAMAAEVLRDKMREADTARSYAANLNKIPALQTLLSNLEKAKAEKDYTKAAGLVPDISPEEKARLDGVSHWYQFGNGARLAELQKIASEREAQKQLELNNLLNLQENQLKARDKYVIQEPSGSYVPLYTMPATGLATPAPAPITSPGKYRNNRTGQVIMYDGKNLVPVQ